MKRKSKRKRKNPYKDIENTIDARIYIKNMTNAIDKELSYLNIGKLINLKDDLEKIINKYKIITIKSPDFYEGPENWYKEIEYGKR